MKRILFCFLLLSVSAFAADSQPLPLLPMPKRVETQNGFFKAVAAETGLRLFLSDTSGLCVAVNAFADVWQQRYHQPLLPDSSRRYQIAIGNSASDPRFKALCEAHRCMPDSAIGTEGYMLSIRSHDIVLSANSNTGLFYGLQTLKQLFRSKDAVPALYIKDWPDFSRRGILDDISRGPIPTVEYMKQQIRRYAEMKFNTLSFYTENVVKTKRHGDFTMPGGAISIQEWQRLADYAQTHHIELIGNFQSFGHFEKILSYPQYGHLGEAGRLLSPAFEGSYLLLRDIYDEMIPVFHSDLFMVNCDETWDLGRGASENLVDSLGTARVYAEHLNRIAAILHRHGKRMVMWADMALQYPQILDMIPDSTILGTWDYSAHPSFMHLIEPLQKNHQFDLFVCPGVLNSRRLMPDFDMAHGNIYQFIADGKKRNVHGVLTTVWDDGGSALFARDWYGVAFAADQSWQSSAKNRNTFNRRFDAAVYNNRGSSISLALQNLTRLTYLGPTQEMNEKIFWRTLVPERGEKINIDLTDWAQVEKHAIMADSLLRSARATMYEGDLEYLIFSAQQYLYMARARMILLNAAEQYRQACKMQRVDVATARDKVINAIDAVSRCRDLYQGLMDQYRLLWLRENRYHWLPNILQQYTAHLGRYDSALILLQQALKSFELHHPLLPPNQVRLDLGEMGGKYFQSWMLCGPFPSPVFPPENIDYLTAMGGIEDAKPTVWTYVKAPGGKKLKWTKYTSPQYGVIDLKKVYEKNEQVLAYAYCRIKSDSARRVKATFGSNDGIAIYCNGVKRFEKQEKRNLMPDEDSVYLPLQKGKNHLILIIHQNKGGWGFSFRLPQETVRNHDYKYELVH